MTDVLAGRRCHSPQKSLLLPDSVGLPRYRRSLVIALVTTMAATVVGIPTRREAPDPAGTATPPQTSAAAEDLSPVWFEPSNGREGKGMGFVARSAGSTLLLSSSEVVSVLSSESRIGMSLSGARSVEPHGVRPTGGISNYLLGRDTARWRTGVPHFTGVAYRDVYPGIDWIFRARGEDLEYDFVVAPGADPSAITIQVEEHAAPRLATNGDLVLTTAAGSFRHRRPYTYQEVGGRRRGVSSRFVLRGTKVSFAVGDYDPTRSLVIDPVLERSSYLGGGSFDAPHAMAVDRQGFVYVAGETNSADFPGTDPSFFRDKGDCGQTPHRFGCEGFVAKLTPDGRGVVFATYLGGERADAIKDLDVDDEGRAHLVGTTASADFPNAQQGQPAGGQDAFVAVLAPGGASLEYARLLGGASSERGEGIVATANGSRLFVTGHTGSTDFPGVSSDRYQGAHGGGDLDAFVARIDRPAGVSALLTATYLGGMRSDLGSDVALAPDGDVVVTGSTASPDFDVKNAAQPVLADVVAQDAFVSRLQADLRLLEWSTFLGGTGMENSSDSAVSMGSVDVDASGAVYVTGATAAANFPQRGGLPGVPTGLTGLGLCTNGGSCDAYVSRFEDNGGLAWSMLLGGAGGDVGTGIAVEPTGTVHVTGSTRSTDFPLVRPVAGAGGAADAFVSTIAPAGGVVFSTLIGGSGSENVFGSGAIATHPGCLSACDMYVTGSTRSPDFPLVEAFQTSTPDTSRSLRGSTFVARVAPGGAGPLVTAVSPPSGPRNGGTEVVLMGEGFSPSAIVTIAGQPAGDVVVESPTRLRAVTPPGAAGPTTIRVSTAEGTSPANPAAGFRYADGVWSSCEVNKASALCPAPLPVPRARHTATVLADGRILVAGGATGPVAVDAPNTFTDSAFLYDPQTGKWSVTGTMGFARANHAAVLLRGAQCDVAGSPRPTWCGKVLVAGDHTDGQMATELFDPAGDAGRGTWTSCTGDNANAGCPGPLPEAPGVASMVGRDDGTVVLFSGRTSPNKSRRLQVYEPDSGKWRSCVGAPVGPVCPGSLEPGRGGHTSTRLKGTDDRVLVTGGCCTTQPSLVYARTDMYDPATGQVTNLGQNGELGQGRMFHTATLLDDGRVLAAGGGTDTFFGGRTRGGLDSAELFDPDTGAWTPTGTLNVARSHHGAARLLDGRVVVAGGGGATSEIFDVAARGGKGDWELTGLMRETRVENTLTLLPTGQVLAVGGIEAYPYFAEPGEKSVARTELFTPPPLITNVTPSTLSASGATTLTISGAAFTPGPLSVTVGTMPATVVESTYSSLTVTAPPVADRVEVPLTVTTSAGAARWPGPLGYVGPPGRVADLEARALSATAVELTFSVPGSVGTAAPAAEDFVVKQASASITDETAFAAAATLCDGSCGISGAAVGERIGITVTDLQPRTTYHYAVRARNAAGQLGEISNSVSATTPSTPPAACPNLAPLTPGQVTLSPGYTLVGLPAGTVVAADGPLYGWFDQGAGGVYERSAANTPVGQARGYWAYVRCPTRVLLSGPGDASVAVRLGAYHASMIGNPSGAASSVVTGHDYLARWDQSANGGTGGYSISNYREAQALAVGEGAWVVAYETTTVSLSEGR